MYLKIPLEKGDFVMGGGGAVLLTFSTIYANINTEIITFTYKIIDMKKVLFVAIIAIISCISCTRDLGLFGPGVTLVPVLHNPGLPGYSPFSDPPRYVVTNMNQFSWGYAHKYYGWSFDGTALYFHLYDEPLSSSIIISPQVFNAVRDRVFARGYAIVQYAGAGLSGATHLIVVNE